MRHGTQSVFGVSILTLCSHALTQGKKNNKKERKQNTCTTYKYVHKLQTSKLSQKLATVLIQRFCLLFFLFVFVKARFSFLWSNYSSILTTPFCLTVPFVCPSHGGVEARCNTCSQPTKEITIFMELRFTELHGNIWIPDHNTGDKDGTCVCVWGRV